MSGGCIRVLSFLTFGVFFAVGRLSSAMPWSAPDAKWRSVEVQGDVSFFSGRVSGLVSGCVSFSVVFWLAFMFFFRGFDVECQ